jgi:hypothetical protein
MFPLPWNTVYQDAWDAFLAFVVRNPYFEQVPSKLLSHGPTIAPVQPWKTEPRTAGQWVRYIIVAVIALFLVWSMLRVYVLQ